MKRIGKHILLIEPDGGRLSELGPPLEELGFVVISSASVGDSMKIVGESPLLSLVAIDDAIGADRGAEVVATVKKAHPDLPVLWVSSKPASTRLSHSEYAPDILLRHPVDAETLGADAERLLLQHIYPASLTELLADSCVSVMKEAYQTTLSLAATHIRANRNALGEVTAILPFVGRHISGRIVVGGSIEHFFAIRTRMFGPERTHERHEAEDLAGEFANLVVGRMKAYFVKERLDFELGTPMLIAGADVTVRYRASRPALVLTLTEDAGKLYVAFCFDILVRDYPDDSPSASLSNSHRPMEAGDLTFFRSEHESA